MRRRRRRHDRGSKSSSHRYCDPILVAVCNPEHYHRRSRRSQTKGDNLAKQQFPILKLIQSTKVDVEDIRRVFSLFMDVKRSAQFLMEFQDNFMFNEMEVGDDDDAMGQ